MTQSGYYWSSSKGILAHTEVGENMVDPFFNTEEEAEQYLENMAQVHGKEQFNSFVLRKSSGQKVKEATAVLTSQQGLGSFATGD